MLLCGAFFWQNIRECFNDDACLGSAGSPQRIVDPDDYCATGYSGPCESSTLLLLTVPLTVPSLLCC